MFGRRKQVYLVFNLYVILSLRMFVCSLDMSPCTRRIYVARAEQSDINGLKCWDLVKVPSCGGRCDSREIPDWEFPFKLSHHPVCVYGTRKAVMVKLRHCDEGAVPGTNIFHFIAAQNCRCKVCSSQHTSCEWLPPNSTIVKEIDNDGDTTDEKY